MSPLHHKTIHLDGMEVSANVIETCGKEGGRTETTVEGQPCTHGYLNEPFEGL